MVPVSSDDTGNIICNFWVTFTILSLCTQIIFSSFLLSFSLILIPTSLNNPFPQPWEKKFIFLLSFSAHFVSKGLMEKWKMCPFACVRLCSHSLQPLFLPHLQQHDQPENPLFTVYTITMWYNRSLCIYHYVYNHYVVINHFPQFLRALWGEPVVVRV